MTFNGKLFIVSHFGMLAWIYNDIIKSDYRESLTFTLSVIIAVSIWQGIHQDIGTYLKSKIRKLRGV